MRGDVLVVDDENAMCELIGSMLRANGLNVVCTTNAEDAATLLQERSFDVVLTDLRLGKMSGLDLCRHAHATQAETPVVVFTGYGDMDSAIAALRAGAADFIPKPANVSALREEVLGSIRSLLKRRDSSTGDSSPLSDDEHLSLEEIERQHIQRVLEFVGGNKRAAARLLKLDRSTLYRKLKRYSSGADSDDYPASLAEN